MAGSKKESHSNTNLPHYDRLVATVPGLEWKGDKLPCTTHNGNMYSFLHTTGEVALRLPPDAREPFLAKFGTKLFDGYGLVQKEYATIPVDVLPRTDELAPYMAMSYEYVKTLKAKPSKKRTAG